MAQGIAGVAPGTAGLVKDVEDLANGDGAQVESGGMMEDLVWDSKQTLEFSGSGLKSIKNIREALQAAGIAGANTATMRYGEHETQIYVVNGKEIERPAGVRCRT